MIESIKDVFFGLPAEVLASGVLLAVIVIYMLHQGRGRAIAASLGLVVTNALYQAVSSFDSLSILAETSGDTFLIRCAAFLVILIVVVKFLNHGIHGEYTHYRGKMIAQVAAVSISFWGLFIAYHMSTLHMGSKYAVSDLALTLFASPAVLALWLVALFASIVFLTKR